MKILITGANGFIGKNLQQKLVEREHEVLCFTRNSEIDSLKKYIKDIDLIFHLAGENRPEDESQFFENNSKFTKNLCDFLKLEEKKVPIIFSSSTQVLAGNAYGKSKLEAETYLKNLHDKKGNPVIIYRLPNIFGKWSKPNYNSVVATFCHNISHNKKIKIDDEDKFISLFYIDDLLELFINDMNSSIEGYLKKEIPNTYKITLGELANLISEFSQYDNLAAIGEVGDGFKRALYSTFLSFLDKKDFSYKLDVNKDNRGIFVEVLKTKNSGQFSFLTAKPGITRGQHYHHSKNEKFIVCKGEAEFSFKNLLNDDSFQIKTSGDTPEVVQTIPGWIHNIKNIGNDDLIVLLWANEIFDNNNPDTFFAEV